MATLTTNAISISGQAAPLVPAAAGGDAAHPGDHAFLTVNNGGGAPVDVTLTPRGRDDFGRVEAPIVVTVAAGATSRIGPLTHALVDPATKLVPIAYSAVTAVTVGIFTCG